MGRLGFLLVSDTNDHLQTPHLLLRIAVCDSQDATATTVADQDPVLVHYGAWGNLRNNTVIRNDDVNLLR